MSALTAQIAGVNLWHGISRSQAALFVLRHAGGWSWEEQEQGGRGAGRSGRFNPSTPKLTPDLPETQVNHNKCAYLSKRVHECTACGGSAAAYRVNKSAGVTVAFLFTVDKDFVWTPSRCCWNDNRGKCRRQVTAMVRSAVIMGWIRHAQ